MHVLVAKALILRWDCSIRIHFHLHPLYMHPLHMHPLHMHPLLMHPMILLRLSPAQ
jgi:hypothetical protein